MGYVLLRRDIGNTKLPSPRNVDWADEKRSRDLRETLLKQRITRITHCRQELSKGTREALPGTPGEPAQTHLLPGLGIASTQNFKGINFQL